MKYKTITNIERQFPSDGLSGMIFIRLCKGEFDNLTEVAHLPGGGVGLVLRGTAPVEERREMFLKVYDGCKEISERIKKDVNWTPRGERLQRRIERNKQLSIPLVTKRHKVSFINLARQYRRRVHPNSIGFNNSEGDE